MFFNQLHRMNLFLSLSHSLSYRMNLAILTTNSFSHSSCHLKYQSEDFHGNVSLMVHNLQSIEFHNNNGAHPSPRYTNLFLLYRKFRTQKKKKEKLTRKWCLLIEHAKVHLWSRWSRQGWGGNNIISKHTSNIGYINSAYVFHIASGLNYFSSSTVIWHRHFSFGSKHKINSDGIICENSFEDSKSNANT